MKTWGAVLRRGFGGEKGTGVDCGLGGGETSLLSLRPVAPITAARSAEGATIALLPSHEKIEKLLKIAAKYGVKILVPGH